MEKSKVKLVNSVIYDLEVVEGGSVLECDPKFALELVQSRRAHFVKDEKKEVGTEVKLDNTDEDFTVDNKEKSQVINKRKK